MTQPTGEMTADEFRADCERRLREDLTLRPDEPVTDAARVAWARAAAAAADTMLDAVDVRTVDELTTPDLREAFLLARAAASNLRRHADTLATAGQPAGIDDYIRDDDHAR